MTIHLNSYFCMNLICIFIFFLICIFVFSFRIEWSLSQVHNSKHTRFIIFVMTTYHKATTVALRHQRVNFMWQYFLMHKLIMSSTIHKRSQDKWKITLNGKMQIWPKEHYLNKTHLTQSSVTGIQSLTYSYYCHQLHYQHWRITVEVKWLHHIFRC